MTSVLPVSVTPSATEVALHLCNPSFDPALDSFYLSQDPQRGRIGILDSGIGGLTVLQEVYRQLPNESVLYFGDTARLPYGIRTPDEIVAYVREILSWLEKQHVKMVILACNTSSALALDVLRHEFNLPILGLILPGARAAVQQGKRIGVIATPATVASQAYPQAILESDSCTQVWQMPCPEFVPLIEADRIYDPYTRKVSRQYLKPLIEQQIDTLLYGCTHYPHLAPVIQKLVPRQVTFVDPAVHVVTAATRELDLLGLRNSYAPLPTRFCVSGCPNQFAERSASWLGCIPTVEKIPMTNSNFPTSQTA